MSVDAGKTLGRDHLLKGAVALGALGASGRTKITDTEAAGPSPAGAWPLTMPSGGSTAADLFAFTALGTVRATRIRLAM
jgi:hypothetical protein